MRNNLKQTLSFVTITLMSALALPVFAQCEDGQGGFVGVNEELSIIHKRDYLKNVLGLMSEGLDEKKAKIKARDYPGSWASFSCQAIVKVSGDDFDIIGYELVPNSWTNLQK